MRELKVPKPWRGPKTPLTQERVRELFDYNELTGDLIKKVTTVGPNGKAGSIIRTKDSSGYYQVMVDGWVRMVHRVIWVWVHGYDVENQLDHIDRCKTNNIISNLREVGISCNIRNQGLGADNKSGVKGVRWVKQEGKYQVTITCPVAKKSRTIFRTFGDFTEAVCHRYAAETCLNWNDCDANSSAYQYLKQQGIIK